MPSRRPGNDAVELSSRLRPGHGNLKRSFSLNLKRRWNVAVNHGHVNSSDHRKSSCLLPNNSTHPVARYNVSFCAKYEYLKDNKEQDCN